MKRLMVRLLVGLLLVGWGRSAAAYNYILDVGGAPATALTSAPGVATSTGDVFYTMFAPAPAYEYSTPSVLSFGQFTTLPAVPGDGQIGNFNADTDFFFYVGRSNGSGGYLFGTDLVHISAHLSGTVSFSADGVPSSEAKFTGGLGEVVSGPNVGSISFASTDPNNGFAANEIDLVYDGVPVKLWVDLIASVPAPTAGPISVAGYLTDQAVPEPGLTTLLAAMIGMVILVRKGVRSHEPG